MAEGRRIPWAEAHALAVEAMNLLTQATERIAIAGSIRRRRADVGDLELVCIPIVERRTQVDLFGEAAGASAHNHLDGLAAGLVESRVFGHRPDKNGRSAFGVKYKRLTYRGVGLDVFSASAETWGAIFTIRTGSADFTHKLVTPRLMGGYLQTGRQVKDGRLWDAGRLLDTPEERDFLRECGVPWIEPEERTEGLELVKRPMHQDWQWVRKTGGMRVEPVGRPVRPEEA